MNLLKALYILTLRDDFTAEEIKEARERVEQEKWAEGKRLWTGHPIEKVDGFPYMRAVKLADFLRRSKEEMVVLCGTEEVKSKLEDIGLFDKFEIFVVPACAEDDVYGMPKRVFEGKTKLKDYIVKPMILFDETCGYKALLASYGKLDFMPGAVIVKEKER